MDEDEEGGVVTPPPMKSISHETAGALYLPIAGILVQK